MLYIEEVDEPLYRIDRMLFQMAHATQLKGIAGVRLGAGHRGRSDNGEAEGNYSFGETIDQMIVRWCGEDGAPISAAPRSAMSS